MSTAKTALLSLLLACWLAGLVNQFHSLSSTLLYLVLSLLIVAVVAAKRQYSMQYAKNRIPPRR
jgi:hypothetical protein